MFLVVIFHPLGFTFGKDDTVTTKKTSSLRIFWRANILGTIHFPIKNHSMVILQPKNLWGRPTTVCFVLSLKGLSSQQFFFKIYFVFRYISNTCWPIILVYFHFFFCYLRFLFQANLLWFSSSSEECSELPPHAIKCLVWILNEAVLVVPSLGGYVGSWWKTLSNLHLTCVSTGPEAGENPLSYPPWN